MLFATCLPENFNVQTQTCSDVFWSAQQGGVPTLSVDDGILISSSILAVWGLAYAIKTIVRFIRR